MAEHDDFTRRGRLTALRAEAPSTVVRMDDKQPMVPAHRLLEVAGALSEGASLLHARLRHLDPEDRAAILDLMVEQLGQVVSLWADLVRGVVSHEDLVRGAAGGDGDHDTVASSSRAPTSQRVTPPPSSASSPAPAPGERDISESARVSSPALHTPLSARGERTERVEWVGSEPQRWAGPYRRTLSPSEAEESERLARDELTGALNRQAGFAALGRELDRCRRSGDRFVLGYVNVDSLKAINEAKGVRAGDELLRKVTAALRATLRANDLVTRLGGDEFLFSLPGADMATAELRFKEFSVLLAEDMPGASASVGFAELRGQDSLDELIARAEMSLHKSRRTRRRVR